MKPVDHASEVLQFLMLLTFVVKRWEGKKKACPESFGTFWEVFWSLGSFGVSPKVVLRFNLSQYVYRFYITYNLFFYRTNNSY